MTLTPKEKAKELVQWFLNEGLPSFGRYQSTDTEDLKGAKFCAIKLVDEVIRAIPDASDDDSPYNHELVWWQKVRQEIKKIRK